MSKIYLIKFSILLLLFLSLFCCTTPPEKPITIRQFSALGLERNYEFDYSKEYLLKHLNEKGMVVFEAKKKGRPPQPFYIKIMATAEGPIAEAYPIE
ncbi:MAG: hypothetical protein OEV42_07250 [Deltaproteobacteria bacterium]|nr:hypothetical protein [Deltaproteobacteria bacterium]